MREAFRKYLIEKGYSEYTPSGRLSTVYQYVNCVENVSRNEGISWEEMAENINHLVVEYDTGGEKANYGSRGNRSVINALKQYREFISNYGTGEHQNTRINRFDIIPGYEAKYTGNHPIYYDEKVTENERIPGLRNYIEYLIMILLESRGGYVLKGENYHDIEKHVNMQTMIPIILSNETPRANYVESDKYLAQKIKKLFDDTFPDTNEEEVLQILKQKRYSTRIEGTYHSDGAEKYTDYSFELPDGRRPYITIYYRNFDTENVYKYMSKLAMCLAHEFFHFMHNILAANTFDSKETYANSVKEALADFSSVMFMLRFARSFSKQPENLTVARKRYDTWCEKFGSVWPYANALRFYFINYEWYTYSDEYMDYYENGSIDKFNDIIRESQSGMRAAYDMMIFPGIKQKSIVRGNVGAENETMKLIITGYQDKDNLTQEEQKEEDDIHDKMSERSNSDKYLLPLYIYDYLKKRSSPDHHVSQKELVEVMADVYDIQCDRKTIGKAVKTLALSRYGIVYDATNQKAGCWYDERENFGYTFRG